MLAVDPKIADLVARVPTASLDREMWPHGVMLFPESAVANRDAAGIEEWIGRQLRVER